MNTTYIPNCNFERTLAIVGYEMISVNLACYVACFVFHFLSVFSYPTHARGIIVSQRFISVLQIKPNQFSVSYHIAQYTSIIADLRKEIFRLKLKISEHGTDKSSSE